MSSPDENNNDNVAKFPDKDERKTIEKEKKKAEEPPPEPVFNLPFCTKYLIIVLTLIHIIREFLPADIDYKLVAQFGFLSGRYTGQFPFSWETIISPVSYIFLHGGWIHLGLNVGMLMAFGAGLERYIGSKRMFVFFMVTGVLSILPHVLFYPDTLSVVIGASGAISGLFGGVIMMLQKHGGIGKGIKGLIPIIVIWVGMTVIFTLFGTPGQGGHSVAWTAHLGGFFFGLILFRFFTKDGDRYKI